MNEDYEVSGHTEITVDGVKYPVGFAQEFVNGYMQGGKQEIMVQGLKYQDSPKDTILFETTKGTDNNFPGTWWKVGTNDGKKAMFQIVTNWDEEKPSYWPVEIGENKVNFGMRLQFWVAERNIYYSTFIDFNYRYDEECDTMNKQGPGTTTYSYFSNAVLNELWVGPNPTEPVKKTTWVADKYCPEQHLSMLLHEEDHETPITSDGNATSAMIFAASAAATTLALTAICAVQR